MKVLLVLQDYPLLPSLAYHQDHLTPGIWVRDHLLEYCILWELPHVWS